MNITNMGGMCSLSWNGTKTRLKVFNVDGRICFEGDADQWISNSPKEYFLKIKDIEQLEKVINFLEVMGE